MMVSLVALFAFLIVLARAATQAITTSEAEAWGLGASPLMLRLPALSMAAIFITVVALVCRVAFKKPYVQVAVFVCLTMNPFVLDHLVAASLPVTSPVYESLFYQLNPELANVYVLPVFAAIRPYLLPAIALSALLAWKLRAGRAALIGSTMVLAMYFLLCLRLDHFKDARAMSTSNQVYATLACLSEEHGLHRVAASADFVGPLGLYRDARPSGLDEIVPIAKDPGREVYAMHYPKDKDAVEKRGLVQFYSDSEGAMVAVAPEFAERLRESPCLPRPK
jgi:hypothetical protein